LIVEEHVNSLDILNKRSNTEKKKKKEKLDPSDATG
jgi:hypothetical protein